MKRFSAFLSHDGVSCRGIGEAYFIDLDEKGPDRPPDGVQFAKSPWPSEST